jgi:hypothetical protein
MPPDIADLIAQAAEPRSDASARVNRAQSCLVVSNRASIFSSFASRSPPAANQEKRQQNDTRSGTRLRDLFCMNLGDSPRSSTVQASLIDPGFDLREDGHE